MHFYTDSKIQINRQTAGIFDLLAWQLGRAINAIFVKVKYCINFDERSKIVTLTPVINNPNKQKSPEVLVKSWLSPLGCWLATEHYACFIYKGSLSESQYRCICRLLIWQLK